MLSDHIKIKSQCYVTCIGCDKAFEFEIDEKKWPIFAFVSKLEKEGWLECWGKPYCGKCLSLEKE